MTNERIRVLVVDDSTVVRAVIVDHLALDPAVEVVAAVTSGEEAKAAILAHRPHLVITDWEMPGMTGVELCRWIRQASLPWYVYVVLLTSKTRSAEMVEGLEAGADDFTSKPIDAAVLRARIRAGARVIAMERSLRELSESDPLTGVLNRRTLRNRFVPEWERAKRYGRPLSCVMVDLDFFKKINDTYGHAAGDLAIIHTARVLRDQRRPSDLVSRYGGEEFCVLLSETKEQGAAAWAERCRGKIAEMLIPAGQEHVRLTASFGVAECREDNTTLESLCDLADQALAVAKASGRDRVICYSTLNDPLMDLEGLRGPQGPLQGALARDAMMPALLCPQQDDTVRWVTDLFLQLRLSSAPVIARDGILVGIISETDLMSTTATGNGWDKLIGEIMRPQVVSFDENTPLEQVFRFFSRVSVRRVVIVAEGRPIGVISRASLLRWFRNWSVMHAEGSPAQTDCSLARQTANLIHLLEAAERRSATLRQQMSDTSCQPSQSIVAEATRLQELADDLLGLCRSAAEQEQDSVPCAALVRSM